MAQVHKHAAAKRDLVEHFVYLAENAGLDTAERFLLQVERSHIYAMRKGHPVLAASAAAFGAEIDVRRTWTYKFSVKFRAAKMREELQGVSALVLKGRPRQIDNQQFFHWRLRFGDHFPPGVQDH